MKLEFAPYRQKSTDPGGHDLGYPRRARCFFHAWYVQAQRWMQAASVRQSKRPAGLTELPPGEVVAMIRSLASCRSLHQRMLTASLQFLEEASICQHWTET